ncbi:MAG: hypothetical protein KDD61_11015, partial [Bdellovibrionales bacterium]|nr:hypothetical protein [Bdellovibrionales bacterium]
YFIFVPEDHGLSNDDMGLVHWRCQLPIYGEFPSLNLAQSVLLTLYIAQNEFHKGLQKSSSEALQETQSPSLKSNEAFPDSLLEEWLTLLGFNLSSKKRNALITLKRLLLNNLPGKDESSTLRAIIYQTVRKLKKLDK